MLHHRSPQWSLFLFGLFTVPAGLYLWRGLGRAFGFGNVDGRVSTSAALVSLALLVLIGGIEVLMAKR
jgi:hypothetical protein